MNSQLRTAARRDLIPLLLLLLVAAAFRFVGIVSISPPGLAHDEVANWLIDRAILDGNHAVYFTQAYGHEAGFHYWQTLFVALVGDHAFALRLPAALAGILLVAVTYALNRRFFGRDVALLSAALAAVLFMPVFYSRLGLRAITLPMVAGLALIFFWDAWRHQRWPYFVLAGGVAGLSAYTYMASRAVPIFFAVAIIYLFVIQRRAVMQRWRQLGLFAATYLLVAWPLISFLQRTPDAEFRISEVDAPLQALLAGDLQPVLANSWALVKLFGFVGDPLWRQNVAGEPLFEPLVAVLFYLGVAVALSRIRDWRFGLLLIWLGTAVIPSAVTVDAPSTIRSILLLPFVTTVPWLPLAAIWANLRQIGRSFSFNNPQVVHSLGQLSPAFPDLSTGNWKKWGIIGLTIAICLFYGMRTFRQISHIWPQNEEVQFVWQAALTDMAQYLDLRPEIDQATIAGWTPETMDRPTMALLLRRHDIGLRHIGTVGEIQTLVVPPPPTAVLRPAVLPLNVYLERHIMSRERPAVEMGSFVLYEVTDLEIEPAVPSDVMFGEELRFLGHELLLTPDLNSIELVTYWHVEQTPASGRRIFMHMVDRGGELLAQHDGLDAPARFWQAGDTIIQYHVLPQLNIPYDIRLGVYDPIPPYRRLQSSDRGDFIVLPNEVGLP